MKKTKITAMVLFLLCAIGAHAQNKWYVDSAATGANDGSSWTNAFKYLSDATFAAQSGTTSDTIFVAKGTYYTNKVPYPSTTVFPNRDSAFIFTRNNLAVLGGYPTAGGVRNADANVTVLSGEIDPSNIFNSAYHIIIIAGANNVSRIDSTLVIDGFTITGTYKTFGTESNIIVNGQAIYNNRGGGIYNRYASPILSNNKIVKHSNDWGGGVYNIFSSPKILNTSIKATSTGTGAGIFNDSMSSPIISNVLISGCSSPSNSIIYNTNLSSPIITNATICGNNGAGVSISNGCHAILKNCIIYGNTYGVSGYTYGIPSTLNISYSDIQGSGGSGFGWSLTTATDLGNNVDMAPGFTAAVPYVQPTAAGNYRLFISSPLINKGDTVGVSQYLPNTDILGNGRILDSAIDMGAYEYVPPGNKIYVDSSAVAGNNTGADWANAFTALSSATNYAINRYANIDTALIAKGTYYPTGVQNSTARDTSFTLTRDNVALIGGYPSGGGTTRNWITNPTILSGDIGTANTNTDNSYHVLVMVGNGLVPLTNSLVLDGLRITSAYNLPSNGGGIVVRGQFVYRSWGGGIYNHYASPQIVNTTILNNNAYEGGGMYSFHSTFKMINSSLKGNVASYGGAMLNDSLSGATILNSVISGNSNTGFGGAVIYNVKSDAKLINTTIAANSSTSSNGLIYNLGSNPVVKNSILYGNDGVGVSNDASSAPVFSYSIIQNSGGSAAWVTSFGIDSGHNLSLDPNFATTVYNYGAGNVNGNFQVQYGSPAIDAGDTTGVIQNLPSVDLWNNPRFVGNNIDMGAYEFGAPPHLIYVDSSATSGANNSTSWSNAFTNLSYATNLARVFPNVDTILVAKGTYYPTGLQSATNRDSSFIFTRDSLVVLGGYSTGGNIRNSKIYNTILSGNIGGSTVNNDNSHHVVVAVGTNGNPIDSTLKIDGFTITGGYANIDTGVVTVNSQPITRRIGGGMANFYASPVLSNIIFTKDTVTGNGGSMYNFHSSPIINNGLFTLNTANNGGAIFDTATSSPVIVSSIFRGNRANTNGAGIYNIVSSSPKILNCLFSGNNAASNGGAILNSTASSPTIINTTISGNFAVNLGGGIINLATSVPVVKNTIIYANNSGITNVSSSPSISYSIVQDGGYAGSNHNINQNPLFQTPLIASNTPSLAGNFMVLGGSAIINVGDTTNVSQYLTATDLFGYPRILGSGIDIGAYEYVRALYVDSSVAINGTGTSWTDALRYLSDATNNARSNPAIDTIMVAKGTYYTTGVVNGTKRDSAFFFTTSKLLLLGGYPSGGGVRDWVANPTIMSGDLNVANDTAGNAYHVLVAAGTSTVPLDSTLKFDGFTITGGNGMGNFNNYTVNGQLLQGNMGGGVVLAYAGPSFNNMVVTKNVSGYGAGWYATNAPFTLSNSTISENKATYGYGGMAAGTTPKLNNVSIIGNTTNGSGVAGIYMQGGSMNNCLVKGNIGSNGAGGVSVSGTVAISNTTISDNTTMGNGGGIAITGTGTAAGVVLDKCIIKNNLSTGLVGGGGIYTDHGAPKFSNCTISGNQATLSRYGGGMYNYISVPVIVNTLITGNKTDNIGAGIYNYQSSPIIVNSTIAGNSGSLPGAAIYNNASSFPSIRNTIISGNSSGIANSGSLPVFKNSVVQGSGGSGASWVTATGTDGGNNSGKEGNFINPASYTLAPDTLGNYSITICSPAVNRGDTTGVGQYIPTTDYAGAPRYNGIIDAGAYEIDPLNPASMNVPIAGGIYTSTKSFQQGNLTHFCNCDSNKLLVTLDTIGTGVVLSDTAAKVRVGTAVAAYYQAGSGFVTNPDGTAVFNREWTVIPTIEPTSPVTVYTYYTDSDYVSVNNVLNSLMLTPLVSDTQMYFYKVTDTSLGLFPSIFSIGINQVQVITYAASPSISGWVAGTLGNNKYAEYQVSSFSGGGGGGSSEGSAPLSLDLLSFKGKAYDEYNLLNWETSENAISWELSRGNNGSDFTTLANGNTDIKNYKDAAPLKGMNYYRLKVNKKDGSSANSAIVMLNSNAKGGSVLIYPVPAKQHITMRCSNEVLIGQKVVVTDNTGRSIYSFTLHAEDNIDISSWATGMYHIQLSDGSSVKIVKD